MKVIDIIDLPFDYQFDTVTCYEYPTAVILNHYDSKSSSCYIMLSKLYGMYIFEHTSGNAENRGKLLDDLNKYFGVEILTKQKISWKSISDMLDKNIPVIVGVNLYNIFYSSYYLKSNWGHWILIKGYDQSNRTLKILDNTQFKDIGEKYKDFSVPYKILEDAVKGYRKMYGEKYAYMAIARKEEFNYKKVILYIIEQYLSIDKKKENNYKQVRLLTEMKALIDSGEPYAEYFIDEFKKKIININKYRIAFYNELLKSMIFFGYDSCKADYISKLTGEISSEWEMQTLKYSIGIVNGKYDNIEINDNIFNLENKIQSEIKNYEEYLLNCSNHKAENAEKQSVELSYETENNSDAIIYGDDNNIIFDFQGNKLYNWWLEDNAPKVLLLKENYDFLSRGNKLVLKTNLFIDFKENGNENSFFKAGIFVRNHFGQKEYLCSVDNGGNASLDEVGITEKSHMVRNSYNLFILIENGRLTFGEYTPESENELAVREIFLQQNILTEGEFELGLACKTWGTGEKLKLKFTNTQYTFLEDR